MKNSEYQNYPEEKQETNKAPNKIKSANNQNNIILSNNNLNNTKYLMDDTMGVSNANNSLFFSNNSNFKNAIIQSKLNNTQNLLNDKNSLFSQARLLSSNASDMNKFKEKYKDLLPEISLQNSVNNNNNNINNQYNKNNSKIEINNETNKDNKIFYKAKEENYAFNNNDDNNNNQKEIKNKNYNSIKSQNEIYIINNIKEENENVETINLTSENQRDNHLNTNFKVSKEEDSENDDEKRNTNLYCLTNSNIENKFYSSILETNDFFKNQKAEKDENIENIDLKSNKEAESNEGIFSFQKLENNFELEKIKNQNYLNDLRNQKNQNEEVFENQFSNLNKDKYKQEEIANLYSRNNCSNRKADNNVKIISFRDNEYVKYNDNRIEEQRNLNENYYGNTISPINQANQNRTRSLQIDDREDIESIDNFTHRTRSPLNFNPLEIQNSKQSNINNLNSQDDFYNENLQYNNPNQASIPLRVINFHQNKEKTSSSELIHQTPNTNRNNYHMTNPSFITANNNSSYFNLNTYRNNEANSNRDFFKNNKNQINAQMQSEFNPSYDKNNDNNQNFIKANINSISPQFNINYTNRRNNTNNNMLFDDSRQSEETMYTNILDILEFDREFINFSVSFPGEILTCEIAVKNISNIDACFEIGFYQQENLIKIFKKYYQSDIKEVFEDIPNTQVHFGCFSISYLEDNNNLSEMDKIRIFVKKGTRSKIILCLKTPQIKKKMNLFSCLEFSLILNNNNNNNNQNLINYDNLINQSSINEMHDFIYNNQTANNNNNFNDNKFFPSEKFLLKNEKYFKYFMPILGAVEIPKLLCLKELFNEKAKFPFISLMLEIKSKGQKFKIPFKNFSLKDLEIELIFEKMPANNTVFCFGGKFYECQFICFPNKLGIPSHGVCEIDLIAKIKKFKIGNNENFDLAKIGNKIRKVLIAKIKNASVYYSFFLEACFTKKKEK